MSGSVSRLQSSKPYYRDEFITLYLGDCFRLQSKWMNKQVLITDPPYGLGGRLGLHSAKAKIVHKDQAWDDDLKARDLVLELWGDKPYAVFGSPRKIEDSPLYRSVPLIWDKGNIPAMGDTSFPWRPTYELIYVHGKGWSGHRGESVLRVPHSVKAARELGHPTPKPIALMEELVKKAPPGVIVDPFAGSGATLIACYNLNRTCIGIEQDEEFAEMAVRRILRERNHS